MELGAGVCVAGQMYLYAMDCRQCFFIRPISGARWCQRCHTQIIPLTKHCIPTHRAQHPRTSYTRHRRLYYTLYFLFSFFAYNILVFCRIRYLVTLPFALAFSCVYVWDGECDGRRRAARAILLPGYDCGT